MTAERIDLGDGHSMTWAAWSPDRELNPQFADLPDVEHCTAIVRHDLRPDDDQPHCRERGFCEGAATADSPVTQKLFPAEARWQVESWEPLTLSPSILCHCGDHGYIRNGCWVSA
jgi:hypothetical protein